MKQLLAWSTHPQLDGSTVHRRWGAPPWVTRPGEPGIHEGRWKVRRHGDRWRVFAVFTAFEGPHHYSMWESWTWETALVYLGPDCNA